MLQTGGEAEPFIRPWPSLPKTSKQSMKSCACAKKDLAHTNNENEIFEYHLAFFFKKFFAKR